MPALENPRHERFAQDLAKGKSAAEAYSDAGYRPNRHNAAGLARKEHILTRVKSILDGRESIETKAIERAIERTAISKEWVIQRLTENVERAMMLVPARHADSDEGCGEFTYQGSVANRALELIGKELGMFIDRKEVGKPGDFDDMKSSEDAVAMLMAKYSMTRDQVERLIIGGSTPH